MSGVAIGANNYAFTYDVCGNLLTENVNRRFSWDAGDRLLFFKNQVGSSQPTVETQYLYDAAGKRVKKITRKAGGLWEIRVYIDGLFEYYTDEVDVQNTVHIMDDKSRVATVRIGAAMGDTTPALKYELENNVMSSMVLLDSSGAVVNSQEYYPFGETSFGSYGKKRYQYVGKERDEESGLYYYGARYYAAWTCRFISVDPLAGDYMYLTPYNYANNNPIDDYDIDGMQDTQTPTDSTQTSNTSQPPGFDPNDPIILDAIQVTGTRSVNINASTTDTSKDQPLMAASTGLTVPNGKTEKANNLEPSKTVASNKAEPAKTPQAAPAKAASKTVHQKSKSDASPTVNNNNSQSSNKTDTQWMDYAKKEIGTKEMSPGDNPKIVEYLNTAGNKSSSDETAWCASFAH